MGPIKLSDLPSPGKGRRGWPWTESTPEVTHDENILRWPKISIITPSYNQGEFIEETIRSVLLQGYPNLEYIVIDGGSTDNTVQILQKYEPFLKYISEPDKGQADAINKGLRMATGEIVAWINSDDYYFPGVFYKIVNYFRKNSDVSIVYGNFFNLYTHDSSLNHTIHTGNFNLKRLIRRDFIGQPAAFFRKKAFFDIGLIDEHLHNSLDYDLFIKLGLKYKFGYIPEVLAVYRWHGKSKSGTQEEKFAIEDFYIIDRLLQESSFSNDILEAAYSHLLESLIIIQLGEFSHGTKESAIPNILQIKELDSYAFYNYMKSNIYFTPSSNTFKLFYHDVGNSVKIFNRRYLKYKISQKIENKIIKNIFQDSSIWISNYLYNKGEYKKSIIFISRQLIKSPSILFSLKTLILLFKILITPHGVKFLDKNFHMKRSIII